MSEAAKPGETLRRGDLRDVVRGATALVAGLPRVIAEGWGADAGRRVLFVPVLMGMGIGGYFALPFEPPGWTAGVGVIAVVAWFVVRRLDVHLALVSVAALVAGTCAGFSLAVVRAQTNDIVVLASETRMLSITGRVARLEPAERGRTGVWLDVDATRPLLRQTPHRIRISINKKTEALSPGDWIEVRATLKPLPAPVAPGSYDFGRKLWFDGIGAVGFSLAPVVKFDTLRQDRFGEALDSAVQDVRRAVSERILAAMSPRTGPIAAAFLTGERGLISDEDNEAMRDSSLAHLLSISGLHMALAGFGFFIALRLIFAMIPPIVLNYPVKKWAAGAAIVASFAYLLLSGGSVPTQRAFVMIAVAS